jgi:hypothetical protein
VLNRELALGLDADGRFDVSIHATEGPGDYVPAPVDLAQHPRATELYAKSSDMPYPDVVIRQMYPPRVDDSPGAITFQYFGWEESRLPQEYVDDFNAHLDGIGTMSTYVCDVLRGSGVAVPMTAVGVGVRAPGPGSTEGIPEITGLRTSRFLHISSAFPRKGVDVLLEAYFRSFTADDDVSLVLKTHANPHNVTGALLDDLRRRYPNPPDVRWIDRDLVARPARRAVPDGDVLRAPCARRGVRAPRRRGDARRGPRDLRGRDRSRGLRRRRHRCDDLLHARAG